MKQLPQLKGQKPAVFSAKDGKNDKFLSPR